jgi:hypothetical protein
VIVVPSENIEQVPLSYVLNLYLGGGKYISWTEWYTIFEYPRYTNNNDTNLVFLKQVVQLQFVSKSEWLMIPLKIQTTGDTTLDRVVGPVKAPRIGIYHHQLLLLF